MQENAIIKLEIKRSRFLRMAPIIIWALAVMLPLLFGSRLYFASLLQHQHEIASQTRQLLMTRSQQFMTRLRHDQIASSFFNMLEYEKLHAEYQTGRSLEAFENLPLVRQLPDFSQDIDAELARFSKYVQQSYGLTPEFLFALNEDVSKCGMRLSTRVAPAANSEAELRSELANMCRNLNLKANYPAEMPGDLKHFIKFPVFNENFGILHYFNTRLWRVDGRFSARLNRQIFMVTMRYPSQTRQGRYLLVGFAIDNFKKIRILHDLCRQLSDEQAEITTGYSQMQNLPAFTNSNGRVELFSYLPANFEDIYAEKSGSVNNRLVVRFSHDPSAALRRLNRKIDNINLLLLIIGSMSFLFAAATALGRLKMTASLTRIIAVSFIACLMFPLSVVFWLGLLQTRSNNETDVQQTMQMISHKISELDQSLNMLSLQRMLLIKQVADYIEKLPMNTWEKYVRYMYMPAMQRRVSKHISNYYLYDASDREFFRGQGPGEGREKGEMSRLFVGASRKLMIQIGAMSGLSLNDRNRISQIADFTSGLMDQLMRPNLLNDLYRTQGSLFLSDFMARRMLFCSHFLRRNSKVIGYMIFVTDNLLLIEYLAEILEKNQIPAWHSINGYQVEVVFYPVNDYDERGLMGRADYRGNRNFYEDDPYREISRAVYAGSDFNQINNLHTSDPHLLVSDRIFNNNIFAFAIARPQTVRQNTHLPLAIIFAIAVTSCMLLATGVAKLLLLQIPPFLQAMREIENDKYDWQLNLSGSDEFAELATSINSMRLSLFERKKMMQLVSVNAIEAARSDLQQQNDARRRDAAILFCDIRNFTTISENHSAEEVVKMLNSYFSRMCPIIETHGGFVDKLIGDAIQAVFYGEAAQAVLAAARAGMQMRESLSDFNRQRADAGLFIIDNGIGIAAGTVVTGLVGSQTGKLEAALLGNVLHQAQQLEAMSKHAKTTKILLEPASWQKVSTIARVRVRKFRDPSVDFAEPEKHLYELIKIESSA